jgi:hypothetical protein
MGPIPLVPLMIGGLVLSAVGTVVGVAQARSAASTQKKIANAQAKVQLSQNQLANERARTQAALNKEQRERALRSILASQRAATAAGGVDPFVGTPLAIMLDSVSNKNREDRIAEMNLSITESQLNINASQIELERSASVSDAKNAAQAATVQGIMSMGSTLFSAGSALAPLKQPASEVKIN